MHRFVFLLTAFVAAMAETTLSQTRKEPMKVAVWDTYVPKKSGGVMHFDIIAPAEVKDTNLIYRYGKEYLKSKGQEGQPLTSKECRFCHIRYVFPEWEADINKKGYYILEMEGCE